MKTQHSTLSGAVSKKVFLNRERVVLWIPPNLKIFSNSKSLQILPPNTEGSEIFKRPEAWKVADIVTYIQKWSRLLFLPELFEKNGYPKGGHRKASKNSVSDQFWQKCHFNCEIDYICWTPGQKIVITILFRLILNIRLLELIQWITMNLGM